MAAGRKTGGRKKGSINKATREKLDDAQSRGEKPLQYMLRVMRDRTVEHDRRDRMAMAAATFLHAKLSTTSVDVTGKVTLEMLVMEAAAARANRKPPDV